MFFIIIIFLILFFLFHRCTCANYDIGNLGSQKFPTLLSFLPFLCDCFWVPSWARKDEWEEQQQQNLGDKLEVICHIWTHSYVKPRKTGVCAYRKLRNYIEHLEFIYQTLRPCLMTDFKGKVRRLVEAHFNHVPV